MWIVLHPVLPFLCLRSFLILFCSFPYHNDWFNIYFMQRLLSELLGFLFFLVIAPLEIIFIHYVLLGLVICIASIFWNWVCHQFLGNIVINIKFLSSELFTLSCSYLLLLCVLLLQMSIYWDWFNCLVRGVILCKFSPIIWGVRKEMGVCIHFCHY